jgi:antitoxin YefM
MAIHTSYTEARANLAELMNRVIDDADIAIITRRGQPAVALIDAAELERMQTKLHILGSPEHIRLIEQTAARAAKRTGKRSSAAALRAELGLEE